MFEIVHYPDERLMSQTQPVTEFDEALNAIVEKMIQTMQHEGGVGLAANQVGLDKQLFIAAPEEDGPTHIFINPVIEAQDSPYMAREGCLSFPGISVKTERFANTTVRYQDTTGESHTLEATGLLAHIIQHEVEHLEGKVFIDKLSPFKRKIAMERLKKRLAQIKAAEEVNP